MNKHFLSGLFLIIISLASCSKREIELDEADPTMVKAITENLIEANATSKSEKVVLWNPGDEIAVFSGELSGKFESTLKKKPSSAAVFRGDLGLEAWPEEMDIWAVYPYSEEAFFDGETITTVLPSEQIARDGEFGKDMNLAIAHSNTSILQFYNVGGGIRFSVTEEGIKKVLFEGLGGEIISGQVKIGFDEDGLPEIRKVVSGSQFITILPPDGQETFQKDTWYYIVVIPGSLERGYKLRFYKDSDYARKVSNNSMKIKRSFYRDLEKADEGIEYETTTTHFPETEDELEKSIRLTNEIGSKLIQIIQAFNEEPNDHVLSDCCDIDGVTAAVWSESETTLSLMQRDSVWLNVHFKVEKGIPFTKIQEKSNRSVIYKQLSKQNQANENNPNRDKLALILAPFQSQFKTDIDSITKDLLFAGYLADNIHYFPDDQADILKFRKDFLSKYSFIVIRSHGATSYRAKVKIGREKHETVMASSTVYSITTALKYISSGYLEWSDIALGTSDGKTWRFEMIPRFIYDASFDDSCVLLGGCETAQILEEGRGNGSLVWQFLEDGAGVVAGNRHSIQTVVSNPCIEKTVKFLAHGLSFKRTYDYLVQSERMAEQNNKAYLVHHNYNPKAYPDAIEFDIPLLYTYHQKNESVPYFMIDPHPILQEYEEPFHVGETMTLSWDCSLDDFSDKWEYNYKIENGLVHSWIEDVQYHVEYDIYLGGTYVASINEKSFQFTPKQANETKWYVIAKIMEGDIVIASYQSGEGRFIVTGETIPVNSVSLDKTNLELAIGNTATLKATILPNNATNKNVSWSSSNPSVATVSSTGEVKGIAKGNATITVKTEDGGKTATCRVTVVETKIPVSGVGLNKSSLSMAVGDTQTLTAIVTPSNATDKSVTWSSSNTSVATVSSSGVVTAKAAGSATITVTTNDGGKKATCSVTVQAQAVAVTGVSLNKTSLSMAVGETQTLTATVTPSNATDKSVTWTSSNTSVATVSSSGVVTAKKSGTAVITVKTNDGGKKATCNVTVKETSVGGDIEGTERDSWN